MQLVMEGGSSAGDGDDMDNEEVESRKVKKRSNVRKMDLL